MQMNVTGLGVVKSDLENGPKLPFEPMELDSFLYRAGTRGDGRTSDSILAVIWSWTPFRVYGAGLSEAVEPPI
jgi:hypothetical protein